MGEYSEILSLAVSAAEKAGRFVREARKTGLHVDAKSRIDFVSDKDRMSEDMIRQTIKNAYPDHIFFGEESVYGETIAEEIAQINSFRDEDFIWVVDPIDGTVNYIHDFPQYAISIGVVHHRKIVAGSSMILPGRKPIMRKPEEEPSKTGSRSTSPSVLPSGMPL